MTIYTSIKHRAVTGLGGSVLLFGMLGVFTGSAGAQVADDPAIANDCAIYVTNQAGPFKKFKMMPALLAEQYEANICSEKVILPGKGNFIAPDPFDLATYKPLALIAGETIELEKGNKVEEVHAPVIDFNPAKVQTPSIVDVGPTSFPGIGIAFREQAPSANPNQDILCKNNVLTLPIPAGVSEVPGGIEIEPGVYRNLDVNNCVVNYVPANPPVPLDYVFNWISSKNSDHAFDTKPDDQILSLIVAKFVSLGHTDNFNSARELGVTVWVAGFKAENNSANKNSKDFEGDKKIFEFGGDGDFAACHVYVPRGTSGIKGHTTAYARFLGLNFEFNGGPFAIVKHPQEICDQVEVECACIDSFSCVGKVLTINTQNASDTSISSFNLWSEANATAINAFNPAANDDGEIAGGALPPLTNPNQVIVDTTDFGAGAGTYALGLIGPPTGFPATNSGYCVHTKQLLELDANGECVNGGVANQ